MSEQILKEVNKNYVKLLKRQGIDASFKVQGDSSVVVEIIEDDEIEFEK